MFTPTSFSLLQSTDFAHRWENKILPMLKAGVIVLADRYSFTAFARDVARGVDPNWVRELYSFAVMPNLALYFRVPLDVAVKRILSSRAKIKYYEAGMDLGLSDDKKASFKMFQQLVINQYDKMVDEFGFKVIDGAQSVELQQREVRSAVQLVLDGWEGLVMPLPTGSATPIAQQGGSND
jgi:dTMP kinase